jgi:MoaA/NifB/PqqE/SkfB family radical SAM enzyme
MFVKVPGKNTLKFSDGMSLSPGRADCMWHRLDIRVGYRCNNYCQFCTQRLERSRYSDRSGAEISAILKKRRQGAEEVVFTGGEVTIRKDFFDLVAYARELGYRRIRIQSNGRMFAYKDFCKRAIEAGANYFDLALHGSNKRIHDSLTRSPGSFNETVGGIKNLKKLKQKIIINTVVNKINYKDLPSIARLSVFLGVDQFQFEFMRICRLIKGNSALIEKIVPRKPQVKEYVKKGLQIGIDNGLIVMVQALPYCFMDGYEDYLAENFFPDASINEAEFIREFDAEKKEKGRLKGPKCPECRYNDVCDGPWKEYPQIFGWGEFKPIGK